MAYELGFYVAGAVEIFLEGKDDHHAADALLHPAEAFALPRPELRADEVDDRDVQLAEFAGEAKIDVGEVYKDGDVGAAFLDGGDEAAVFPIDAGHVVNNFSDAHVGDIFGTDDAVEARGFHLFAAEAEECGTRAAGEQFGDELRAIMISAGFACGEKDARIGCSGIDGISLFNG